MDHRPRFDELARQGQGPQRHEGAVTRPLLEDRVLRGFDPMTGVRRDGVTGRDHRRVSSATRFKTAENFVASDAFIRRSPEFRETRERTRLVAPNNGKPIRFRVELPIADVLGPEFRTKIEGVKLLNVDDPSMGTRVMSFENGFVIAIFEVIPGAPPRLVTMYPKGS